MKLPEGYEQYTPKGKLLYCLLLKALYGLKQGGRQWYLKLAQVMKELGFRRVRSEPCVYVYKNSAGDKVIVPVYVDDCHIAGKTRASVDLVKQQLASKFKLRNLGQRERNMHARAGESDRAIKVKMVSGSSCSRRISVIADGRPCSPNIYSLESGRWARRTVDDGPCRSCFLASCILSHCRTACIWYHSYDGFRCIFHIARGKMGCTSCMILKVDRAGGYYPFRYLHAGEVAYTDY